MKKVTLLLLLLAVISMAFASPVFADDVKKLQTGDDCIVSNDKITEDNSTGEYVEQEDYNNVGSSAATVSTTKLQSVKATNIKGGIVISWDKVKKAEKYELYKKHGKRWKLIKTTAKAEFMDSDVSSGKTYSYGLKTKVNGKFGTRKEVTIKYLKSPKFSLKNGNVSVAISWDSVPGATKYAVYRKTSSGSYKKLIITTGFKYKDSEVGKTYKTYVYYVKALSGTISSGYAVKSIKHIHVHSYTKSTVRKATYDVCGADKYICECGKSYYKNTMNTAYGKFSANSFATALKKAKTYEVKETPSKDQNRDALDPAETMKKPRYLKYPDGVYKSPSVEDDGTATIMFTGDLMCMSRQIRSAKSKYGKYTFKDNFEYVKDILSSADFTVGNLETMTRDDVSYHNEEQKVDGVCNCNAPSTFQGSVRNAGFDMVMMANNHDCDTGVQGIFDTIRHAEQYGLIHTGLFRTAKEKRYEIVEIDGIKVAFMAYASYFNGKESYLTEEGQDILLNEYSRLRVKSDVANAKAEGAEYIIAYIHAGAGYTHKVSERQKNIFQAMADSGVDYIIGSHAHELQKYKLILASDGRTVPAVYSMGNFSSHILSPTASTETLILQIGLKKNKAGEVSLVTEGYIPVKLYQSYNNKKYTLVPLTKPYNTCGVPSKSGSKTAYDSIVKTLGNDISPLGKLLK